MRYAGLKKRGLMNGFPALALVSLVLAVPIFPDQNVVTVNPNAVVSVQPAPCARPQASLCATVILLNGDKVSVVGSVEDVSLKLTEGR